MKYVIGINAYHGDASACILRDGELIAAAEEERFRRIKHWAGFPSKSIQYCLAVKLSLLFEGALKRTFSNGNEALTASLRNTFLRPST